MGKIQNLEIVGNGKQEFFNQLASLLPQTPEPQARVNLLPTNQPGLFGLIREMA